MNKIIIIISILSIFFVSCTKENLITDSEAKLAFSNDTITFDTVFTTIGSTTRELKIYNPHSKTINISSIELADNSKSFRLNINGISAKALKNIEIAGEDSLYIFIEVTVNPMLENAPIEIIDSIVFNTNGNIQDVKLQAFGQDMHIINGEVLTTQTWVADKPYLILNSMLVDSLETLTIEAGASLHFSRNSTLYVKGNLKVNGEFENPVTFEGSRLDYMYTDVPGQWQGIVLLNGSQNNSINYAIIKNAVIGLNVGYIVNDLPPSLELSNTKIEHHSHSGIYALDSKIRATNCIIGDCGYYLAALINGGEYEFFHCTLANYWNLTIRQEPSLVITNFLDLSDYNGNFYTNNLTTARFENSIIYGVNENELGLGKFEDSQFNYLFKNCILRTNQDDITEDLSNTNYFTNITFAQSNEKLFVNPYEPAYNFNLDTIESIATNKGNLDLVNLYPTLLEYDIDKMSRTADFKPDLGAYELKESSSR